MIYYEDGLINYKQLKAKYLLIYLKLVFEYSKNNQYSKDAVNAIFIAFKNNFKLLNQISKSNLKKDLYFYKNITSTLLNSTFINNKSKEIIQNFKGILGIKYYIYFHKYLFRKK